MPTEEHLNRVLWKDAKKVAGKRIPYLSIAHKVSRMGGEGYGEQLLSAIHNWAKQAGADAAAELEEFEPEQVYLLLAEPNPLLMQLDAFNSRVE